MSLSNLLGYSSGEDSELDNDHDKLTATNDFSISVPSSSTNASLSGLFSLPPPPSSPSSTHLSAISSLFPTSSVVDESGGRENKRKKVQNSNSDSQTFIKIENRSDESSLPSLTASSSSLPLSSPLLIDFAPAVALDETPEDLKSASLALSGIIQQTEKKTISSSNSPADSINNSVSSSSASFSALPFSCPPGLQFARERYEILQKQFSAQQKSTNPSTLSSSAVSFFGSSSSPALFDLNADQIRSEAESLTSEADLAASRSASAPKPEIHIATKMWNKQTGGFTQSDNATKTQKRKHHINSLAYNAALSAAEIEKAKAAAAEARKASKSKYGW